MPNKYIARLNGQIVGKRTSQSRSYSHAYVMQHDEAATRAAAYDYVATKQDRKNYDWHAGKVARGIGAPAWPGDAYLAHITLTEQDIAAARAQIEGGFESYVARQRQRLIGYFETSKARGVFKPFVGGWASRRDLAEKAARQYESRGCKLLAIVPAEKI